MGKAEILAYPLKKKGCKNSCLFLIDTEVKSDNNWTPQKDWNVNDFLIWWHTVS